MAGFISEYGAVSTQLQIIDPLSDSRWNDLVASHPRASVFHSQGWMRALADTYGYRPFVVTNADKGQRLSNGIAFCEVRSWLTGTRLVSLPFADHCEPLLSEAGDASGFTEWLRAECHSGSWKYVELRPLSWQADSNSPVAASTAYWFHTLDLTSSLTDIFDRLDKNSIQRRIRHAEREQLSYETGCSEQMTDDFFRLLLITRRRHQLFPQPRDWFRNLIGSMGDNVQIHLARKNGVPVAAVLTLRHRNTVVYKYGCSDAKFHHLGAMPLVFWRLIEASKAIGAEQIDFGRTDMDNGGLASFKDRLGTRRSKLTYLRCPEGAKKNGVVSSGLPIVRWLSAVLPDTLFAFAGRCAYRHIG